MKILFNGAARTVTGSRHLIEINGRRLLLDCGLFQGRRKDFYERNQHFDFDVSSVDAVILSHAHIDHSGNLPNLVKNGYEGPIFTTEATAELADVMLQDAGHIQESDAEFVNKKRALRGEPPIEPLYTIEDAMQVKNHFRGVRYGQTFEPIPGVTARLLDAGHILGSAGVQLDVQENGKRTRLWFSGDIGRENLPLMRDPITPDAPDYLIMECTYGDKLHRDPQLAYEEFRDVVYRTVKRRGKVIIPAFAVGRTQEIVYSLNRMFSEGELQPVPVFVDSPLAVRTSQVFQKFTDLFDAETQQFIREERHPALNFKQLRYVQSADESKSLNFRDDPMVIISASGMAETGRILHHLKNNIEDPKNTVCIVSWQAPNTLGRRLAEREPEVRIYGEYYNVRAEIATIGGLSAHAGQNMLVKYAQAAGPQLREIFLVHGEQKSADALSERLHQEVSAKVSYPDVGEEVDI